MYQAFPTQFIEHAAIDARADGSIAVDVHVKNVADGGQIFGMVVEPGVENMERPALRL